MSNAKVIRLFLKPVQPKLARKPKKVRLLDQSNPDVNSLGRITIAVVREEGEPWAYAVEDEAGPVESFTDLAEAVDYVRQTIEDSARTVALCERLGRVPV